MQVSIKKWGNSASVRIPASVMSAAKLKLDSTVDVREEAGRIVIEPIRSPKLDLAQMLEAITPENIHSEMEFGGPVGKEWL